jgi:threonine/homoserine/homoserine lactone efflux protein
MNELLFGLVVGFLFGAPFGPAGLLAALKTLSGQRLTALSIALGACVADAALTALGTLPASYLETIPTKASSGLVAVVLAVAALILWRSPTPQVNATTPNTLPWGGFAFGLTTTLLHPANIVAYALIVGWAADKNWLPPVQQLQLIPLCLGVFIGSLGIWLVLIVAANRLKNQAAINRLLPKLGHAVALLLGLAALFAAYHAL